MQLQPKPKRRRDRLVGVRVTGTELQRWHRVAGEAGLTLAELVREGVRIHLRTLEREARTESEAAS